jgi:hypothetical protein
MKLKNSTDFADYFLRRMVAWCCKKLGLPQSVVKAAQFRNRSGYAYSGRAWCGSMRFVVSLGPEDRYPTQAHLYPGRTSEAFRSPAYADRIEGLIGVTAHELTHLREVWTERQLHVERHVRLKMFGGPQKLVKRRRGERRTRFEERRVIEIFRAERESLLAQWNEPPAEKPAKPKPSAVERRAESAILSLAQWQRKLKLAQTKVRKYKQKVRYYERKTAANQGNQA